MATIRNLCTRCVVLDKGKLIFEGDVEEAISVYMKNSEGDMKCVYDLRSKGVSDSEWYGNHIIIDEFKFMNKEQSIYDSEEDMIMRIKWHTKRKVDEIRARIEIKYADGTIVGMTESKPFICADAGKEGESTIKMGLSNLAPGTYYLRFSLFTLNSMGVHTGLIDVPEKVFFKVVDTLGNRTNWLRQYWGSVRFDELEVLGGRR